MDNIRALVSEELNIIEDRLHSLFAVRNDIFCDLNTFLLGNSKRIRSMLCLLFLKMCEKSINDKIIELLCATELFHNASLLHDDVIDNSSVRRGVQTLYDKYDSKISVLSGDYVLSTAVEKLLELHNTDVLELFFKAAKKMSEAEVIQYGNRGRDISLEQYKEVISGKTASLFCACIKSSAMLSGIDINFADNFAVNFGILFQINNDMQEESIINDNNNGIKTAADIIGIEKTLVLKDNYKEELSKILVSAPDNKYKQGIEDLIKLL